MSTSDLCYLSISEAADLLQSGKLSPVDLINAHLDRIEATDGRLNSFITLLAEESLEAARNAERSINSGDYLGPLHGIPVGLKDLYYTKGVRTTIGSKILRDFVPDTDAAVTESFKNAGAIIIGKLQMHEFALGPTSINPHDGPAHNPWNVERVTGGSSGGSGSSVAAGQVMGALGSDTGGSVRIPAALCGIVGLKPTFGRVSRYGVYPLSWSLDTVGPMTRTVRDNALVLNTIAGHDSRDPWSVDTPVEDYTLGIENGVEGLRIGIPNEYFFDLIDAEVSRTFDQASHVLEGLGARVERVFIPILERSLAISGSIMMPEAAAVHIDHLRNRADDMGKDVRDRLETGALTPATDYIVAQQARRLFNRDLADVMTNFDLLLTPTVALGAPRIDQPSVTIEGSTLPTVAVLARLTRPFNICGFPTVTVPSGFTKDGMPIGLQIAGRVFDEATVLRAAYAYEQATDWHTRRPPL
ncbi:MAG: amidase [Chloroflexi bacterium]|nr:amidase [Chloroflexota bacterium]